MTGTSAEEALAAWLGVTKYCASTTERDDIHEQLDIIKAALTQAAREQRAWGAIGDWAKNKSVECRYARSGWHHFTLGASGEVGGCVFQGADRLEALEAASAWCEQQEKA